MMGLSRASARVSVVLRCRCERDATRATTDECVVLNDSKRMSNATRAFGPWTRGCAETRGVTDDGGVCGVSRRLADL